jgi:hypothetical protein
MAKLLCALPFVSCLSTALAGKVPRQAASTQYTEPSVTTKTPTNSPAPGAFCCQVYAIDAGLNSWYTDSTVQVIQETIVTQYLQYNNTIIPTATVTITNSSAANAMVTIDPGSGAGYTVPGIPTDLAGTPNPTGYYLSIVLTETQQDFGYTTVYVIEFLTR